MLISLILFGGALAFLQAARFLDQRIQRRRRHDLIVRRDLARYERDQTHYDDSAVVRVYRVPR